MPHRDPETGKFVSSAMDSFHDIEVVSFNAQATVGSADIATQLGNGGDPHNWEGLQLIDYDEIVDRNEELVLLTGHHQIHAGYEGSDGNTPGTQYGVGHAIAEISASPARTIASVTATGSGNDITDSVGAVTGTSIEDDTIDILGRPLGTHIHQDFSDDATAKGGAAGESDDSTELIRPPAEMARFHPRDELFYNGMLRLWNSDVMGVTVQVLGQHVYGVVED